MMLDRRGIAHERAREEYVQTLFEEVLENDEIKNLISEKAGSVVDDIYLNTSSVVTESDEAMETAIVNRIAEFAPDDENELIERFIDADDDSVPSELLSTDDDTEEYDALDPDNTDYEFGESCDDIECDDDDEEEYDDDDEDEMEDELRELLEESGITVDSLFGDLFTEDVEEL